MIVILLPEFIVVEVGVMFEPEVATNKTVAFDVSNAVGEATGGAAACTANVMYANEPGMTISFVD